MGTFQYTIEIGDVQQQSFQGVELWVDTGATYTWLPRDVLEGLGYSPTFLRQFRLADGSVIERELCWASVRLNDEVHPTPCVFGDHGSESLLGAMTLETFSLGVDSVNRLLMPVLANALHVEAIEEALDKFRVTPQQAQGERAFLQNRG